MSTGRIVALAGGVGAARLLRGLTTVLPADRLTVVVNTADDEEFWGLYVSPDIDTIIYNFAGLAPPARGWGLKDDSHRVLTELRHLGGSSWFGIGDRDLATHLTRTEALNRGEPLHQVTRRLALARGVQTNILPMSNERVRTFIETESGRRLPFQRYFVERKAQDPVHAVRYRGLAAASPAPGVLSAINRADTIIFPPSNPFTSLLPILKLRGIRPALRQRRGPIIGVSPVAGGRAVHGPLAGMLRAYSLPVSPMALVKLYRGILDGLLIDSEDKHLAPKIEQQGIAVRVTDIRMETVARSRAVAHEVLSLANTLRHKKNPR